MVRDMLTRVGDFTDVKLAGANSNGALETFDPRTHAMKFICKERIHHS